MYHVVTTILSCWTLLVMFMQLVTQMKDNLELSTIDSILKIVRFLTFSSLASPLHVQLSRFARVMGFPSH